MYDWFCFQQAELEKKKAEIETLQKDLTTKSAQIEKLV